MTTDQSFDERIARLTKMRDNMIESPNLTEPSPTPDWLKNVLSLLNEHELAFAAYYYLYELPRIAKTIPYGEQAVALGSGSPFERFSDEAKEQALSLFNKHLKEEYMLSLSLDTNQHEGTTSYRFMLAIPDTIPANAR